MGFDKEDSQPVTNFICFVITGILVLFALIIAAILYLTVFKATNPVITVKSVTVTNPHLSNYSDLQHSLVSFTVTIYTAVKNPNIEIFKYDNNTVVFYYYGTQIGIINSVPGGRIVAEETEYLSATLTVQPFPFIPASQNPDFFSDANSSKIIPIDFTVYMGGDARVLYFFTSYVKSIVYCNFVIDIKQGTNLRMECS